MQMVGANEVIVTNEQFTQLFDNLFGNLSVKQDAHLTEIKKGIIESVLTQAQVFGSPCNHFQLSLLDYQEINNMLQMTATILPHLKTASDINHCLTLFKEIHQLCPLINLQPALIRFQNFSPLANHQQIKHNLADLLS